MPFRLPSSPIHSPQRGRGLCRLARVVLLVAAMVLLSQSLHGMPRPPQPPYPEHYQYGGRFDNPAWLMQGGWDTLGFLNLKVRESWSGYALDMSGAGPALLALPLKAANVCWKKIMFEPGERVFSLDSSAGTDLWRGSEDNNSSAYPAEIELLGVEYVFNSVYNGNITLKSPTNTASGWVFDHVSGLTNEANRTLTGLLGYEVDGCWLGGPACNFISSACPDPTTVLADSQWGTGGSCTNLGNTIVGHSYMTLYTNGNGARVFAAGSMQWNWGLDDFGFPVEGVGPSRVHPVAQQMTHNVLCTFAGKDRAPIVFVNADAMTEGDWGGVYGSEGYMIAYTNSPLSNISTSFCQIEIDGADVLVWANPSGDPRALVEPSSSNRIASAWTTTESQSSAFTIDLTFTNTTQHLVTLYCADWLGTGTCLQQIDVYDSSTTSPPLDTRAFQLPPNGIYLVWALGGHKIIRVTKPDAQSGTRAMVSALFFDPVQ